MEEGNTLDLESRDFDYNPSSATGAPGWLRQLSVQLLISAQVMISRFVSLRPALGSVLTVWSCMGFPVSLPLCPSPAHAPSLSQSQINKLKKNNNPSSATDFTYPGFNLFAYKIGILIFVWSYEDKLIIINVVFKKVESPWGAWVAQSVEHLT